MSLVSWLLAFLIPIKVLGLGYRPPDDALRHVAKALSGKTWQEILILEPGFQGDWHPGWHAILSAAHRLFGLEADQLLALSVAAPFALFWLALIAGRRRPEAMLGALALASVAAPDSFVRLLLGRPFVIEMVSTVILLRLWTRVGERIPLGLVAASIALIGFSFWVRGTWFLFGIVVASFALCGPWRRTAWLAGCWLAGTLLGAALTGDPVAYLRETTGFLLSTFEGPLLDRMLASEVRADYGDLTFVMGFGLVLVARVARGEWRREVVLQPLFVLAALGWLLGLQISRFWSDWGFPAAILWLADELDQLLEARLPRESAAAALLTAFLAAASYLGVTRDLAGRWTRNLDTVFLSQSDLSLPGIRAWLPEPGGIVYSSSLEVFYRTFYANPRADWRYQLGFEAGLMPREDRHILREIQRSGYAPEAYAPWVKRMRPEDRLILLQSWKPGIAELEWYYAGGNTWIGRLPRAPGSRR